jgi:hypothetical protein
MLLPKRQFLAKRAASLLAGSLTLLSLGGCNKPVKPGPLGLGPDECAWVFTEYQPSPWEREWKQGEDSGERRDRECEILATPVEAERSLRLIRSVTALMHKKDMPTDSLELFSRMKYAQVCGPAEKPTGRKRVQLIEPLVGLIRDPLSICDKAPTLPKEIAEAYSTLRKDLQAKENLLLGPAAPWTEESKEPPAWQVGGFEPWTKEGPTPQRPRERQKVLIDMGASTYTGWDGQEDFVGAKWLVEHYQERQVSFDWVVSYEYEKIDPDQVFAGVPPDLLPHYIYYNHGVEKAPESKWNPWRILRGMGVTRNDYVVAKLDIDTPEIENDLFDQVLSDPRNTPLIDEFFYEHHVNTKAMYEWWKTEGSTILLKDTYRSFTAIRAKGIRMHNWP